MFMKTFYFNSDKNIVTLNIDVLSLCNFKCPYCYNIKRYHNIKHMLSISNIQSIINDINSNLNNLMFDIKILGGEPFLHPRLVSIVEMFSNCKRVRRIDIFTNGSIIKSFKRFSKVRLYISIHPECDYKKVNELLNINNVDEISFMVHKKFDREKYIEYSTKFSVAHNFIVSLDGKLHFIDLDLPNRGKYYFKNKLYSVDEVFLNHFNMFKKWNCLFSIVNIDVTGNYGVNCLKYTNRNIFLDHFLKTVRPEFMTCTREECNEDCNLGCYKYTNE